MLNKKIESLKIWKLCVLPALYLTHLKVLLLIEHPLVVAKRLSFAFIVVVLANFGQIFKCSRRISSQLAWLSRLGRHWVWVWLAQCARPGQARLINLIFEIFTLSLAAMLLISLNPLSHLSPLLTPCLCIAVVFMSNFCAAFYRQL